MTVRLGVLIVLAATLGCDAGGGGSSSGSFTSGGSGSFSDGCFSHSDCGSALVCVTSACQSAFPRVYVFTFESAEIAAKKSNGKDWDTLFGNYDPDPRAVLEVDGDVVCQTSTAKDTYYPKWNESCEVELFESSEVVFAFWDADGADPDDPIVALDAGTPLSDSIIKDGGLFSTFGSVQLDAVSIRVRLK